MAKAKTLKHDLKSAKTIALCAFSLRALGGNWATASLIDEKPLTTWGGFVDVYYAGSSLNPKNFDRQYTTQAVRNNEFNLNLAFVEAKIQSEHLRGRLALQAGTSVQANYSSEPTKGLISGGELSRHVQEAFAGYRIADHTWIDAGIMLSHIGLESFVSRDNPVYTRSLVADFSPYYQTGVRVSQQLSDTLAAQLLIVNGWQNISESNDSKAIGTQLVYTFQNQASLAYNTFFGSETSFRHFHDLIFKYQVSPVWGLSAQADVGFQSETSEKQKGTWYGFTLISRHEVSSQAGLGIRFERYSDPKNILVATPSGQPFRMWAASVNYDQSLLKNLVWRSEVKFSWSDQDVFASRMSDQSEEGSLVSSLGLSF